MVILFLFALKEKDCNGIFQNCVLVSHVIHDKFFYSAFFFSTDVTLGQKLLHLWEMQYIQF